MSEEREKADKMLAVRCTGTDFDRLDAIADQAPGVLTRHSVARAAMRIGMTAIEADPRAIFQQRIPKRGGSRPKRTATK